LTPASCALLVNEEQVEHSAPEHPERPDRIEAILRAVAAAKDLALQPEAAPVAPEELILEIHDRLYISFLDRAAAAGGGYLDPDTYMRPGSMRAARTASGAVVEGVRRVLGGAATRAFAVVRPCGHHAERARPLGFCLINNVAVGVAAARAAGVRRIAVIDFDVHHGNGTQETFYADPDLLYCSTHQYGPWGGRLFFPGTGAATETGEGAAEGTTLNVPLPPGTAADTFLLAYEERIGPAVVRFQPDLLMVSAGFDAHERDPMAGLNVTTPAYARLAELIIEWADRCCQGRAVWALEGGYDLKTLGECAVASLRVMARRHP